MIEATPNAQLLMAALILTCAYKTLTSGYRYLLFRMIDRTGYQTPELQALHLLKKAGEQGKVLTQTRRQGIWCIAWLAGFAGVLIVAV
ncbi:hypothetical protein HX137_31250 [Pseudomonas sp. 165]|uniref:Uncharacterized protein n=1 Tax=Pseudomonas juntendi TaxID=2666183 RepID=A0AAJ5S523_9PSED|nr:MULTISPECIES: hypothetical protein [Pseudomonas]MDM1715100.1 hypothetical protein [Pseudomonas sp. 165]WEA23198.1 hypothetical protein PWA60_27305 [Pseudomonas juntendi]